MGFGECVWVYCCVSGEKERCITQVAEIRAGSARTKDAQGSVGTLWNCHTDIDNDVLCYTLRSDPL